VPALVELKEAQDQGGITTGGERGVKSRVFGEKRAVEGGEH